MPLGIVPQSYFNPLPRKEGDSMAKTVSTSILNFNPLPRKEGDRPIKNRFVYFLNFNPLPRKEGDRLRAKTV